MTLIEQALGVAFEQLIDGEANKVKIKFTHKKYGKFEITMRRVTDKKKGK